MFALTEYHLTLQVLVITWPRGRWLIITRGSEAPEGVKLAKRPRGYMITGLLQFELLLCQINTE